MTYKKSFPLRKSRFSFLNISLLILLIVVGILYLFQINLISSYSFEMKDLNDELEDLRLNNAQMEQEVTSLQSIESIYQLSVSSEMIRVAQVDYLTPPETSVAAKK